ncbi:unnamed protein product [Echinostoma caproni]|uniref:BRF1 domain-containing protein n=1 Tax=Echinostoma caproni TaxID=27848 RepID=A0A183A996_9TREM|nr:unnamed protein product [Echinostoma caproni]
MNRRHARKSKDRKPQNLSPFQGRVKEEEPRKAEEELSNLMTDEMDDLVEEELLSEADLMTMLQADMTDEWDVMNVDRYSRKKSTRQNKARHKSRKRRYTFTSDSYIVNTEPLGLMQHLTLSDAHALTMGLPTAEGRACVRRLFGLLLSECAPKAIYRKYIKDHQIVLDLSQLNISHYYG